MNTTKKVRLVSLEMNRKMRWSLLLITSAIIVNIGDAKLENIPLGGAINMLQRHGSLDDNIRVMWKYDLHEYIFREPTVKIFKNASKVSDAKGYSILSSNVKLYFCDNAEQLLKSYFENFKFEGVQKPWNTFIPAWTPNEIAIHFGIHKYFIKGNYSYVFLRYSRYHDSKRLAGSPENLELDETFAREANNITVGDTVSLLRFANKFGTHYVNSIVSGDSLYQVFVYEPQFYRQFKEIEKTISADLLNDYLSPRHAADVGYISTASGILTTDYLASEKMEVTTNVTYSSLLMLDRDKRVLEEVFTLLEESAILELDLRSLAPLFKDPERRRLFEEVIDNYLKLYDIDL